MPKSVLVAAAEDSWSQTIVPRLIAAGADLDRVFRVEITADAVHSELIRPRDLANHRQHHNHDHRNHHRSGGQVGQWRLCRPPPPTQRTRSRVRKVAHEVDAVLLILDPLISRLDPKLDSHKDADVRMALEPLVAMADLINISVLGTKLSVGKSARPRLFFGVPNSRRLLVSSSGSEIRVCTERATAGNRLGRHDDLQRAAAAGLVV